MIILYYTIYIYVLISVRVSPSLYLRVYQEKGSHVITDTTGTVSRRLNAADDEDTITVDVLLIFDVCFDVFMIILQIIIITIIPNPTLIPSTLYVIFTRFRCVHDYYRY